ncbi:MAG TPA: GlsB/YeaQ/YmgE family stress response membrane protein [Polyangiaceae bacterium]|nr:GlsB/YeaQ/YmgE family stress response membrane protein [Polyangiaceae bacterium]
MIFLIFLIFGFFVGLLARALLPGRQGMGLAMTTVLGITGSFLGGLLGNFISGAPFDRIHPAGMLGSVLGAIMVLAVTGMGRGRFSA